jgi:hypothetical protein
VILKQWIFRRFNIWLFNFPWRKRYEEFGYIRGKSTRETLGCLMSYSRWSNSVWYTYADVHGGFTVCGEKNFSDKELEDIDACLNFFRGGDDNYTEEEIEELRGYMLEYKASRERIKK